MKLTFVCILCLMYSFQSSSMHLFGLHQPRSPLFRSAHNNKLVDKVPDRLRSNKCLDPEEVEESVERFTQDYLKAKKAVEGSVGHFTNREMNLEILAQIQAIPTIKGEIHSRISFSYERDVKILNEGGLAQVIPFHFDPLKFLYAEPDTNEIIEDAYRELDNKPTNIQIFMGSKYPELAASLIFYRALQANDPYARAVMYASFKNGFFGTKGMEGLAKFYKEGIHEPTVVAMENKFDLSNKNSALLCN